MRALGYDIVDQVKSPESDGCVPFEPGCTSDSYHGFHVECAARQHGMERRNRHTKKPANRFAGFRVVTGAPGEIRTPDPQVRSLVLYPAELRARMKQKRNFAGIPAVPSISQISLGRSLGPAPDRKSVVQGKSVSCV